MLTIGHSIPNRLDIELSGQIDGEQMQHAIDELLLESSQIENGTMLYVIRDFHLPTLEAIAIKMKYFSELLKMIKRFQRVAIVIDESWLQSASEFEGKFFTNLEIRAFDANQKLHAEAWLDGVSED